MIRKTIDKIVFGWVILLILAALIGDVTFAASDGGRTAADFLQIGVGARSAGMGNAYSAVSDGAEASYWNPAGMSGLQDYEVSFSHFAWYQDVTLEQGSFAFPVNDRVVMAASIIYLDYGSIEGYDASNNSIGDITAYDWAGGLSIGYTVSDAFAVGLTGKYINQKFDETSGSAFAADLGATYRTGRLTFAAVASNLGGSMTFENESEDLPSSLRLGVAYAPPIQGVRASFELDNRFHGASVLRNGVEVNFYERYFLRTGYDVDLDGEEHAFDDGLSFGAGVRLGAAAIDYAYSLKDQYSSEDVHRFSVLFRFGR
ncbi:PorV/PorQ family protein [candidate division GN15 bacterium]|nr:PorV/PorQ family protein [candidate division GN15 bacterium]